MNNNLGTVLHFARMTKVVTVIIAVALFLAKRSIALKCNGITELCDLDITQVTLAGSHNSGAGFDGVLDYHTAVGKVPAVSCFYRNQDKSFTKQLEFGIRYFDIDACWEDSYQPNSAWVCHEGAYGGSIKKMLSQIDMWMKKQENRNEVIVIHFNRDFAKLNKGKTGIDIIKQLSDKWEPTGSRLQGKQLSIQSSLSIKLGETIRRNQRIYIIMHSELSQQNYKPWIKSQHSVGYTWTSKTWLGGCHRLVLAMGEDRCKREAYHNFVRYDLYLSSGLCISELASACNQYITEGVSRCFKGTKRARKTVNFILVDYVDNRVIAGARYQNIQNVKMYLGKDI